MNLLLADSSAIQAEAFHVSGTLRDLGVVIGRMVGFWGDGGGNG